MRKQKKKGSEEREKHSIEEELEGSTQNLEKYQLLLLRNEQLATEIIKLRSKNRNLISELQEYRRKQFYRRYETKCTQTSLELLNSYISDYFLPFRTPPSKIKHFYSEPKSPTSKNCREELSQSTSSSKSDFRSIRHEEIKEAFQRLSFSKERDLFSPVISPEINRQRRNTRAPISYKEPLLNTKIRKGHQFFKLSESTK